MEASTIYAFYKISTDHVYNHFPEGLPLLLGEVDEDITVWVLEELECHSQVVVFQHGLVIVPAMKITIT